MLQCLLTKGQKRKIAWIDVKSTDKGKYVDIKTDDGFDTDWYIAETYGPTLSKKIVSERGQDHKNMRKMTDI